MVVFHHEDVLAGPEVFHADVDGDVRGVNQWRLVVHSDDELTGVGQGLSFDGNVQIVIGEMGGEFCDGCECSDGEFADFRKIRDVHMFKGVFGGVIVGTEGILIEVAGVVMVFHE